MDTRVLQKTYTWEDVEAMCVDIALKMAKDGWMPDYIVGITRGGNVPATILSHMLNVRCEALKVALRDGEPEQCETNCWMSEDAFGYVDQEERELIKSRWDNKKRKNILVVDDINDTGATFNWIKQDWESSCLPGEESAWGSVWHGNVRFAVLTDNVASDAHVDYCSDEVNKAEDDVWLIYPWEKVGKL